MVSSLRDALTPLLSAEDFALIDKDVSDASCKLIMVWNVYDFFMMMQRLMGGV